MMHQMAMVKASIRNNLGLWVILLLLLLLNVLMVIIISHGFSMTVLIILCMLLLIGSTGLIYVADSGEPETLFISNESKEQLNSFEEKISPDCEAILAGVFNDTVQPILDTRRQDFAQGLNWLWETGDDLARQIEQGTAEISSRLQMVSNLSEDKFKMVNSLRDNLDYLAALITELKEYKQQDFVELDQCLDNKAEHLKRTMDKEKEIFYEYISKLLLQQMEEHGEEDIAEYMSIKKLGGQFQILIKQSIDARLSGFEDELAADLENFAADMVGRMQKSTLQITNLLSLMEESIVKLVKECHGEGSMLTKRLEDAHNVIIGLKEKSSEIMITLAWQDILIEKRWQAMEERLFRVRDQVLENVDDDVTDYIANSLSNSISGFAAVTPSSETAVIYKALIDAEIVYQVYLNKNLPDVITDGVVSLLLYVRPLELIARKGIRFSEEGNALRRVIKDEARSGGYTKAFARVRQQLEKGQPELVSYVSDLYPKSFYGFCVNPYIKQRTENLNQAAWMLFMLAAEGGADEDILNRLVGLLLAGHQIRSKYIQPLKNVPKPLEDDSDLNLMRYVCFETVGLFLNLKVNGLTKLNFSF